MSDEQGPGKLGDQVHDAWNDIIDGLEIQTANGFLSGLRYKRHSHATRATAVHVENQTIQS